MMQIRSNVFAVYLTMAIAVGGATLVMYAQTPKPTKSPILYPKARGPKLIGQYKEGKIPHHYKTWDKTYTLPNGARVRLRWVAYTGKLISNSSRDGGKTWSGDFVEIDNFRKSNKGNYIEIFQVSDGSFIVYQYVPQIVYKKKFGHDKQFKKVHAFPHYSVDLHEILYRGKPRLIIPRNIDRATKRMSISDDLGDTWREVKLPAPPKAAGELVEPNQIELLDECLWTTYRSQVGAAMYQMFSADGGETWTTPEVAPLVTGRTWQRSYRVPAGPHKGALVFLWANMRQSAREDRRIYNPGRQALHMAISHDDGKTWRGFRQVNVYPFRYGRQPATGDRGATDQEIVYEPPTKSRPGRYLIYSGNGNHYTNGGRHVSNPFFTQREIEVDLDWLMQNFASDDFSAPGIDNDFDNGTLSPWLLFKRVGKGKGQSERSRIVGPVLIPDGMKKVLWIRRTLRAFDGLVEPPDVATWNFPSGRSGVLTTRIRLGKTFAGARIRLNDQLYFNSDGYYSKTSIMTPQFALSINPKGQLCGKGMKSSATTLTSGVWAKLQLAWDLDRKTCDIVLNGVKQGTVALGHATPNGVCYVRFESTANRTTADPEGFCLSGVSVRVANLEKISRVE